MTSQQIETMKARLANQIMGTMNSWSTTEKQKIQSLFLAFNELEEAVRKDERFIVMK